MDGAIVADNIKTSTSHKKKNVINVTTNPRLTAMMIMLLLLLLLLMMI